MRWLSFLASSGLLAGCSLLTSLDGLQRGDAPIVPTDSGPGDVTNDASPGDAAADHDSGPVPVGALAFADSWGTAWKAASVAALPKGGFFVGGAYQVPSGQVNVGPYFLPTPAGTDAVVVTLDAKGKVTGALGFGGAGTEYVSAVAADGAGGVYLAGVATAGAVLNGTNVPAGGFVAKLDATNLAKAPAWIRSFTGSSTTVCASCLQVTSGNVVALMTFGSDSPVLDFGTPVTTNGGTDMVLVKLDAQAGNAKWKGQIGGSAADVAAGLAVDVAGAVYVTGSFEGTLAPNQALGAPPAPVGSVSSILVAKLLPDGTPGWAHAYGDKGGSSSRAACVATDGNGHVAVGVTFGGGMDFGLGVVGASNGDGIVFALDEAQNATVWQQTLGDTDGDSIEGCSFDPWGHVVVTGTYRRSPKIGTFTLTSAQLDALYVAKLSPGGAPEWAFGYPRRGLDGGVTYGDGPTPTDVAIAPDGTVVVSGSLVGITDFGSGFLSQLSTVKGFPDALVVGWAP